MGYTAGNPVTGLTVTLDGEPETIRAIWTAAVKAMEQEFTRFERERRMTEDPVPDLGLYLVPRYPVHGQIELRTTP